jgi:hypothetical protein
MASAFIINKLQHRHILWFGPHKQYNDAVVGKLYLTNDRVFVCQDDEEGLDCGSRNRFPFKYSFAYSYRSEELKSVVQIAQLVGCTFIMKKFSI